MLAQTHAQGTGSPIASEFSHRDTSISTSSSSMVARLLATATSTQSQRLAAANSVAAATSTHGADDAHI
jgi:hypothetical protein